MTFPPRTSLAQSRTSSSKKSGNPDDRVANALPRGVDVSRSVIGAQQGFLRPWTDTRARDPQARVSHRGLTLTPVTLPEYAGPLRSRTGRGFHDRYHDLRPLFPLKKSLRFISDGLAFLRETRLTVHTG